MRTHCDACRHISEAMPLMAQQTAYQMYAHKILSRCNLLLLCYLATFVCFIHLDYAYGANKVCSFITAQHCVYDIQVISMRRYFDYTPLLACERMTRCTAEFAVLHSLHTFHFSQYVHCCDMSLLHEPCRIDFRRAFLTSSWHFQWHPWFFRFCSCSLFTPVICSHSSSANF